MSTPSRQQFEKKIRWQQVVSTIKCLNDDDIMQSAAVFIILSKNNVSVGYDQAWKEGKYMGGLNY